MTHAFSAVAFSSTAFDVDSDYAAFQISGRSTSVMQKLGFISHGSQSLWYDYSDSELFYLQVTPPELTETTLFVVPSSYARRWFANKGSSLVVVYNPFIFEVH